MAAIAKQTKQDTGINLDLSQIQDETSKPKETVRSVSRVHIIDNKDSSDAATEEGMKTKRNLEIWIEKAKSFITSAPDDELPALVPLKQVIERPSTVEQKMRAVKEIQAIKEKQKENEERLKREAIDRERKAIKARGPINYDYEGGYFEIKPTQAKKKFATLIRAIP